MPMRSGKLQLESPGAFWANQLGSSRTLHWAWVRFAQTSWPLPGHDDDPARAREGQSSALAVYLVWRVVYLPYAQPCRIDTLTEDDTPGRALE